MMKWINKKRNKKGFTLVELVVVIAILGILATLAIPKLTETSKNAQEKVDAVTLKTITSAYNIYEASGESADGWPKDYLEGAGGSGKDIYVDGYNYSFSTGTWIKGDKRTDNK